MAEYGTFKYGTQKRGNAFRVTVDMMLEPLGLYVTKVTKSLIPPTRDNTEEIPGRHGEINFGPEFRSDMIELEIASPEGMTAAEIEALRRTLARKFNPLINERTLIFDDEADKSYQVKYSGKITPEKFPTWFKFVLPLKLNYPLANGLSLKSLTGSGTLTNAGTFETGLIIEILGAVTNPSLTIGNVTLTYEGAIAAGQTLTIDTGKQTAKIGSSNAMAEYNGEFPLLQPGSVNVTAGSNVTIHWRDKYL